MIPMMTRATERMAGDGEEERIKSVAGIILTNVCVCVYVYARIGDRFSRASRNHVYIYAPNTVDAT